MCGQAVERPVEPRGIGVLWAALMSFNHRPRTGRTTSLERRVLVRSPSADRAVDADAPKPAWLPLGALLVREELISNEQLELALIDQQGTGLRLGELLVQWGWVESAAISRALAEQYEMDFVDLDAAEIDPAAVRALAARDARAYDAIPIRTWRTARLLVGVADPTDVGGRRAPVKMGGGVSFVVVDQIELHRALAREYTT